MHGFQAESHAHQQKSNVHTLLWMVTPLILFHTIVSAQFIFAGHHHPSLCAVSQLLTPAKGTLLTFIRREVLVLVLHARWHAFNLFNQFMLFIQFAQYVPFYLLSSETGIELQMHGVRSNYSYHHTTSTRQGIGEYVLIFETGKLIRLALFMRRSMC